MFDASLVLRRHLSNHAFDVSRDSQGRGQWRILWQPHVHVREVLQVRRKELRLQLRREHATSHDDDKRRCEECPAMCDRESPETVVGGRESCASALLTGLFGPGSQQVVAQQGNEGHRDNARRDEGARNHHRQAVQELTGITRQEQKRQVGDDVRDRRKEDGGCQLGWPEPRRDERRMTDRQVALDGIAGYHRVVDEKSERDDQ